MTYRTAPEDLFPTILALTERGRPFAVATILKADGSTPLPAGRKAVIESDGGIHGTVGGGAVEAEVQRRARGAVRSGNPVVFDFDLRGPGMHEANPICGGSMRLLVDPSANTCLADYHRAVETLARRERGVWVTTLEHRDRLRVNSEFVAETDVTRRDGFPRAEVLSSCLSEERPILITQPDTEATEVFVEPLIPRPVLLIVGGGHVGQAVAAQASLLGFEIVVFEDRPEFTDARLFPPDTRTCCGHVADELAAFPIGRDTFIVIVTRGHQHDSAALRVCIGRPAAYIGMIGSRRKVPLVRQQFLDSGWGTAEEFARIHAPIGLDLGAVTVPEIATSIVAQMIAVRRKGAAPRMPLT